MSEPEAIERAANAPTRAAPLAVRCSRRRPRRRRRYAFQDEIAARLGACRPAGRGRRRPSRAAEAARRSRSRPRRGARSPRRWSRPARWSRATRSWSAPRSTACRLEAYLVDDRRPGREGRGAGAARPRHARDRSSPRTRPTSRAPRPRSLRFRRRSPRPRRAVVEAEAALRRAPRRCSKTGNADRRDC